MSDPEFAGSTHCGHVFTAIFDQEYRAFSEPSLKDKFGLEVGVHLREEGCRSLHLDMLYAGHKNSAARCDRAIPSWSS